MPLPRIEQILTARGINGILIPPHGAYNVAWDTLNWEHFGCALRPHLCENGCLPFHSVTADHAANAALAFSKMREHGYGRIGSVAFTEASSFLQGFLHRQFQDPMKLRIPPLIAPADRKNVIPWFKRYKPDAILTEIPDVLDLLDQAGYRIPDDIAVAGTTALDIPGIDAGIDQHPGGDWSRRHPGARFTDQR